MRNMPRLQDGAKQSLMTTTFLGYNHNEIIRDGECFDMKNMSGDMFPLMTVRKTRAAADFSLLGDITGINGRDQLTLIIGSRVFWNMNQIIGLSVSTLESMCPKTIVNFGAYVLIFPDRKYFNTINLEDFGNIDRLFETDGEEVSLTMCRGDGTDYDTESIERGVEPPEDPENGDLWMDTSGNDDVLRQFASLTQEWVEVPTTYVKIEKTGIGIGLNIYDAVTISGLSADTEDAKITAQVDALNGSKIVYFGGENYIVVAGLLSVTQQAGDLNQGTVRVDRTLPDLDFIVESNNRLWGCRYGLQDGNVVNEIYASALGDFRNWNRFLGNSQDSYRASVGTDGTFTGAAVQNGYPVFLKENCIHQVYGATPSSFQIRTTMCRGVQSGSGRSVTVVNEQIYYKSRTDVMMFDGSMPVSVSDQLGGVLYSDARAGALGKNYYISMKDAGGDWTLFVYDTENNLWYKEDDFRALGFGRVQDELFAVSETDGKLWRMKGTSNTSGTMDWEEPGAEQGDPDIEHEDAIGWTPEDDLNWSAEFGLFGTDYRGKKYLSRFDIRMYVPENTVAHMWIQYDSDGVWRPRGEIRGNRLRSFVLPVVPVRCDHLRVKLTGTGDMRIYSIARIMEDAQDG